MVCIGAYLLRVKSLNYEIIMFFTSVSDQIVLIPFCLQQVLMGLQGSTTPFIEIIPTQL